MEPQDVFKTVRTLAHMDPSSLDETTREQMASMLTFALDALRENWISPEEGAQELRVSPRRFRAILKRYQILEQQRLALENIEQEEEEFFDTLRTSLLPDAPNEGPSAAPEEHVEQRAAHTPLEDGPRSVGVPPLQEPTGDAASAHAPFPLVASESAPPLDTPDTDASGPLEEQGAQMAQEIFAAVQSAYDDELQRLRLAVERLSTEAAASRRQSMERLETMHNAYQNALDSLVARAAEERQRGETFFSGRCEDFARAVHGTASLLREENAVLRNKLTTALQDLAAEKERSETALQESATRCRLLEERLESLLDAERAARETDAARNEAQNARTLQELADMATRWAAAERATEDALGALGQRVAQDQEKTTKRLESLLDAERAAREDALRRFQSDHDAARAELREATQAALQLQYKALQTELQESLTLGATAQDALRQDLSRLETEQLAREKARDTALAQEWEQREAALRTAQEKALQEVHQRFDTMDRLREEHLLQTEARWEDLLAQISRETATQMEAIAHIREEKMGSNVEIAKSQQFQGQMLKMLKMDLLGLSSETKKDLAQLKERYAHLENRRQGEESRLAEEIAAVEHRLVSVDALKNSLRNEVRERELLAGSLERLLQQQQDLLREFQENRSLAAEARTSLAESLSRMAETVEDLRQHGATLEQTLALRQDNLGADVVSLREEGRALRAEDQHQREQLATELRDALASLTRRVVDLRAAQAPSPQGAIDWLFGGKRRE